MDKKSIKNSPATDNGVTTNPWQKLRELTDARIGLGRSGVSIPTNEGLAFQLAHAKARDAVHTAIDFSELEKTLQALKTTYAHTS